MQPFLYVPSIFKNSEQADGQLKAIGASNEYLHTLNSAIVELTAKFDTFLNVLPIQPYLHTFYTALYTY